MPASGQRESRRRLAGGAVALALFALACAADVPQTNSQTRAVSGGLASEHSAVVALTDFGVTFCSGVLVAPRVVLTAASCVAGTSPELAVLVDDATLPGGELIAVNEIFANPDWGSADYAADDVALLLLATEASVEPLPLSSADPIRFVGEPLEIVGFGATEAGTLPDGLRRSGQARLQTVLDQTIIAQADPGNTCLGDAGGPILMRFGGQQRVIALSSLADSECEAFSIGPRIDVQLDGFVNRLMLDLDPDNAPLGEGERVEEEGDGGKGDQLEPGDETSGCMAAGSNDGSGWALWAALLAVTRRRRRPARH